MLDLRNEMNKFVQLSSLVPDQVLADTKVELSQKYTAKKQNTSNKDDIEISRLRTIASKNDPTKCGQNLELLSTNLFELTNQEKFQEKELTDLIEDIYSVVFASPFLAQLEKDVKTLKQMGSEIIQRKEEPTKFRAMKTNLLKTLGNILWEFKKLSLKQMIT